MKVDHFTELSHASWRVANFVIYNSYREEKGAVCLHFVLMTQIRCILCKSSHRLSWCLQYSIHCILFSSDSICHLLVIVLSRMKPVAHNPLTHLWPIICLVQSHQGTSCEFTIAVLAESVFSVRIVQKTQPRQHAHVFSRQRLSAQTSRT